MLFNSLEFAVFLVSVFGVYSLLAHRLQNRWLLVASYTFYSAWDWRFLSLILISTVVDYSVGLQLSEIEDEHRRRRLLALSVVTNLGILGVVKYAGFFAESLQVLLAAAGISVGPFTLEVVLPIGISFYTFQTLGYTIDVYHRRFEPTQSFLDFALFVAFFPQLIAGPIERASRLLPQITKPRRITLEGIRSGVGLMLWGLFKKVVISDNLSALVNAVYARGSSPEAPEVLLATYAFAIQIYCDFSGYTDIARGVGRILGFDLMRNFRLPYVARNPSDFWRRWHISLSTWFRDYLYIPLGGNRAGHFGTYRNLFLTMLLGGLWHGAGWNFVAWGAFHGGLLVAHRIARRYLVIMAPTSKLGARLWRMGSIVLMFHLVCVGWVLFRAESLAHAGEIFGRLLGPWRTGLTIDWLLPLAVLVGPLVLMQVAKHLSGDLNLVRRFPMPLQAAVYASLMLAIVLLGEDFGQPFIYFQF